MTDYIVHLDQIGMQDLDRVGGKNASLGEMIRHLNASSVKVPGGFATTVTAFREFLASADLDARIANRLRGLNVENVGDLIAAGKDIRAWVDETPLPDPLASAIDAAYDAMSRHENGDFSVAVRSSATAEDLPTASFAGQQETYLNVRGVADVKRRIKDVFASLFNDRAISYRVHHGFEHSQVALSAGVQRMVRSDLAASGVLFTLDTESGFRDVVFITASYGLGELVVQGAVNPDEFYVYKPALRAGRPAILRRNVGSKHLRMGYAGAGDDKHVETLEVAPSARAQFSITDEEVHELGRVALAIEAHYGRPMDVEWAKDGVTGEIYVVQARPETVQSHDDHIIERFKLQARSKVLAEGRSIGQRIGAGPARVITDISDMDSLAAGGRARYRHDRSRLGAGDETGGGDRDEPWRPNVPCGHYRA